MKINKTISIEQDINDLLAKETNASKLINDLLSEFFKEGGQEEEQLRLMINSLETEILEKSQTLSSLKLKYQKIQDKQKELKERFEKIPEECLIDFRAFPQMNEEVLRNRFKDIYSEKYPKLSYGQLKEAWINNGNKQD